MTHATFAEHALIDDGDLGRRGEIDVVALTLDDEVHRQTGAHQRRFPEALQSCRSDSR